MMSRLHWALFSLFWVFLAGCQGRDGEAPTPVQTVTYSFEENAEGWAGGFADYPADWEEDRLAFQFSHAPLPEEVNQDGGALKVSGKNLSDDLFIFVKKQISGLRPEHTYAVTFQVELASQYPQESFGIGGSPGSSVYLKVGGSTAEPQAVVKDGYYRMNIDKGNQAQGGEQMVVAGTVGIPGNEFKYQLIRRDNLQEPVRVRTDAEGKLWVVVGTDSGFEGTTTLYYNQIEVMLKE
jgi:hypothetical protein